MDVDGLEVDSDADAEDEDGGDARGLLCGADGPGGDMKEDEEEEEEVEVNIPTGPSSMRVEPQTVALQVGQHRWKSMVFGLLVG